MVTASWDTDPFPKVDASLVSPQKATLHLCSPASPCLGLQGPHHHPPTPLTPSHMCVPLALASSSPGQELDTHSQHPRALPVSFPPLCLALPGLIHPLVGCQHMPCPVGGQGGQGDWVTVLSENGPQSRAEPAATSTSSLASLPAHKLSEISETVAEGPRLHAPSPGSPALPWRLSARRVNKQLQPGGQGLNFCRAPRPPSNTAEAAVGAVVTGG